jgi:hypothetical protein
MKYWVVDLDKNTRQNDIYETSKQDMIYNIEENKMPQFNKKDYPLMYHKYQWIINKWIKKV